MLEVGVSVSYENGREGEKRPNGAFTQPSVNGKEINS